jgi:surface antigen
MKGNDMKTAALRPLAGVLALAILPACTAYPDRQQEQAGVVIGAIVGGVLGSQIGHGSGRTVATIVGTMVGAVVGGNIGRSMDESDRLKTAHSLETVRSGVSSRWRNPDTGNQYTVTPVRTFDTPQGPCREYTVDAVVGGKAEKVYGTACRQADGSWRAMN